MKTMPLSEVKTKLSELVDAVERRDEEMGSPVSFFPPSFESSFRPANSVSCAWTWT